MKISIICRMLMVAMLTVGSLALAGCGKGMSGKYTNGSIEVEFKSGSTAYVKIGESATTELKYEMKGDKITLHNQAGNMVLTLNKDGTLSGAPMENIDGPLKKIN